MSYQLPANPQDLSVKPLQYGYSLGSTSKLQSNYMVNPTPYFNGQINNPNNNASAKMQSFVESHTDQEHMRKYAQQGAKWLFNNFAKKMG